MGQKTDAELVDMLRKSLKRGKREWEFFKDLFPTSFFPQHATTDDWKYRKIFRTDVRDGDRFSPDRSETLRKSLFEPSDINFWDTSQKAISNHIDSRKYKELKKMLLICAKEQNLLQFVPNVENEGECVANLFFTLIMHSIDGPMDYLKAKYPDCPMMACAPKKSEATNTQSIVLSDTSASKAVEYQLKSTSKIRRKPTFCGREAQLTDIAQTFENDGNVCFLSGMGGIGKTELAKEFARRNSVAQKYRKIIFAEYSGSLLTMVNAERYFSIVPEFQRCYKDGCPEDDATYFKRKLSKIKELSDEQTLVIIDNFNTTYDAALEEFLDGPYHVLVTTWCDYSKTYPTVHVEAEKDIEAQIDLFMKYYGRCQTVKRDDPVLKELLLLIDGHTYTIELLALHMQASMQSAAAMLSSLKQIGIQAIDEKVAFVGTKRDEAAYKKLSTMFSIFNLTEDEQKILRLLSLMPLTGIAENDFAAWAGLTSLSSVLDLENKGWIKRSSNNDLALHTIVRDVIQQRYHEAIDEGKPQYQYVKPFIDGFIEQIKESKAWHFTTQEKEYYATIALSLIDFFDRQYDRKITGNNIDLYKTAEMLLSFSVNPQAAIDYATRIYQYYAEASGTKESRDHTYRKGRAAYRIGWTYLFNLQLDDALNNAWNWLKKAEEILSRLSLTKDDEKITYAQLLGNLSRVILLQGNQDPGQLRKAKEYAEQSVKFNNQAICGNKNHPEYTKTAGGYMQLADAHIALHEADETWNLDDALKLIDDAYDILWETFKKEDDPDTLHASSRKAIILCRQKKYQEALQLSEKNIKGYDSFYGKLHFGRYEQLTTALESRIALANPEKEAETEELYKEATEIAGKIFSKDSIHLQKLQKIGEEFYKSKKNKIG